MRSTSRPLQPRWSSRGAMSPPSWSCEWSLAPICTMKGWACAPVDNAAHLRVGIAWRRLSTRAKRRGGPCFSMASERKSVILPSSRARSHTAYQEQSRWCGEYEMNRHWEQLAQCTRHVDLARCQGMLASIGHDPLLPLVQSPASSTVAPQWPYTPPAVLVTSSWWRRVWMPRAWATIIVKLALLRVARRRMRGGRHGCTTCCKTFVVLSRLLSR